MKKLLIFLFIPLISFAQDDVFSMSKINKDSEKIFNNFGRLGIKLGLDNLTWVNGNNQSIGYNVDSGLAPTLGLEYNFYQTGQFNFMVGLNIRHHNVITETFIQGSQIGQSTDLNIRSVDTPYWNYMLPIGFEYNKFLFKDVAISLHLGYEFMYYGVSPDDSVAALSIDGTPIIFLTERERQRNISSGFNLGGGLYFKAGTLLMHLGVMYHLHTREEIIFKQVDVVNLQNSPDSQSRHGLTGDYVSFNLTIHPQNWFKRKAD